MDTAEPGCQGPGKPIGPSIQRSLLRNPNRKAIMRLLKRHPGMNRHQLSLAVGIHSEVVQFHVDKLRKGGLVETRAADTNPRELLCFTRENVHLWDNEPTRVLFGRGVPRRVAAHLMKHPGVNAAELSEALGLAVPTVRRHLQMLEGAQLVEHIRVYEGRMYQAKPELREWVERIWMREG